ncbi:hypothetical protein [Cystobacter fuscus]|uniref:hypothetical protein n=1 Tax=Cystobacter fuscus TaxID=43 RepID=UPI002B2F78F7|nr:hypothetical protein F0U63_32300 [Cystobacter fuscus]
MKPRWEKVHAVCLGRTEKPLIRQPVIEPLGLLRQGLPGLSGSCVPDDGRMAALLSRALKVAQRATAA